MEMNDDMTYEGDPEVRKKIEEIKYITDKKLSIVDIDNIKNEGITLRIGKHIIKLDLDSVQELPVEDEIREEYKNLLSGPLKTVKESINEKMFEMETFINEMKRKYDNKEKDLIKQLKYSEPMPMVTMEHASRGLSITRGSSKGRINYIVQGVYRPLYIDRKPIEEKFARKMITSIVFFIETNGNDVLSIHTHKLNSSDFFSHYHQTNPDCWGDWVPQRKFKTPDDIINLAREAEAVLENINTNSIAKHTPLGLPRLNTVRKHLLTSISDMKKNIKLDQLSKRTGIEDHIDVVDNGSEMWSL